MNRVGPIAFAAAIMAAPTAALAWGSSGHRIIGQTAMQALPSELPGFLRTPGAAIDVGEFSPEPDRAKGAGKAHDSDRETVDWTPVAVADVEAGRVDPYPALYGID